MCLATYQGERYVREQLESVLPQLGPDDEVVVSDDASTDGTVAVIEGMGDDRIRVIRSERNLGYSRNFERALSSSKGDVVFICDQDDVWLPGKVQTMLVALERHDLVVADVTVVDSRLAPVGESHFSQHGVRTGFVRNFAATRYIGASMAMRRRVLDVALPLPPNQNLCAYDYWITLVAEAMFDVGLVAQPQMLYRRHETNASTGGATSENALSHKLAVRAYCFAHLARRRAASVRGATTRRA